MHGGRICRPGNAACREGPRHNGDDHFTGYLAKAPPPVYPPEKVARIIVRMLQHPKAEVFAGGAAVPFSALRHLLPGAFDRVGKKQSEKHLVDAHQRRTEGNLYQPVEHGQGVHGEAHGRSKQWLRRLALFAGLGFAARRVMRRVAA